MKLNKQVAIWQRKSIRYERYAYKAMAIALCIYGIDYFLFKEDNFETKIYDS